MQQPILCECGDSIIGDVAYVFSLLKKATIEERLGEGGKESLRPVLEKINLVPASTWNVLPPMDAELRAPLAFDKGEDYSMEFAFRALGVRKMCCKTHLNTYMVL